MSGGDLWDDIASFGPLCVAARRAARGKRRTRTVATWLARLEQNALHLERELRGGTWRPGRPTTFVVRDPKRRTITAAPFGDRVVHHALMDRLEPLFEERFFPESFACRKGKGTHAALSSARALARRFPWFLKVDVERCFDSIPHEVALGLLADVTHDARALDLAECIVRRGGQGGRGLPIGNLTSQGLANLVLHEVDVVARAPPGVGGYVRYMDDCLLFARDKACLRRALESLASFMLDGLGLRLNARATRLAPVRVGVPFLGWQIFPGTTRIAPENLRRTRRRLRARRRQREAGRVSAATYEAAVRSSFEHLRHGSTLGLRRRIAAELGAEPP